MLEVKNIEVRYGSALCLRNLSISIQAGEIVTIIGSNGAGKTTLLRTISGLKRASAGKIVYQDHRIDRTAPQNIVAMGIGHVPQGRGLFPYMSVKENIRLGAYLIKDRGQINTNLARVLEVFPVLKTHSRQLAGTLSGGEQQMLAIARALMGRPALLLLDEPSVGLAPLIVKEIGKIAEQINQAGTSILIVEQNARLALSLAHRGYVLETGKIVLQGNAEELQKDAQVKKAYLG